jgi:ribosome recycling factor
MPRDFISVAQPEFQDVLNFLRTDLSALRTGRATPAIVENVMIEAYGGRTALVGLASLSIPDARTILIEPWDKSILKDIERGIQEAKLGVNPVVQGNQIRVALPQLTEESRRGLIKVMNEKLENARISIRNVRETARAEVTKAEKEKEIAEDDKYRLLEQIDKVAAGYNEQIKNIGAEKETEIMTI